MPALAALSAGGHGARTVRRAIGQPNLAVSRRVLVRFRPSSAGEQLGGSSARRFRFLPRRATPLLPRAKSADLKPTDAEIEDPWRACIRHDLEVDRLDVFKIRKWRVQLVPYAGLAELEAHRARSVHDEIR